MINYNELLNTYSEYQFIPLDYKDYLDLLGPRVIMVGTFAISRLDVSQ